ncbi:MAG: metallophosphoesterase [Clostridia bacterium]|nr:metallophosphoesterase [Clostridia bacterium]
MKSKRKLMTRILLLVMALLTVFSMSACNTGGGNADTTSNDTEGTVGDTQGTDTTGQTDDTTESTEQTTAYEPEVMKDPEKAAKINELLDTKHELRVDENGNFKVLVLSDVQFDNPALNRATIANIEKIVKREDPDLVIFNGDNSTGITSEQDLRAYVARMTAYLEMKNIPWCHVYGNHDAEGQSVPREKQQEIYESFDYCLSKAGDADLFGMGNYVLPVLEYDSDRVAFNVWCFDSGTTLGYGSPYSDDSYKDKGNTFMSHYEYMQQNQVDWFEESAALLAAYNEADSIPGMMAFHIPLQETFYAWYYKDTLDLEWTGEKRENVNAHAKDVPLFDAAKENNILAIVNSHEHINDFMVKYEGIRLCYTACIGNFQYHAEDMLGGRAVIFDSSKPDDVSTYMSYVNERPELDKNSPILELVIDSDGTVKNNVVGRPELESYDYAGSTKTVKKDSELERPVISFTGGKDKPSVYNISAKYMDDLFKDGFSYEVAFKINDGNFSTGYVGILDYEEAGGWGLDLYKNSSNPNKPTLKAEVGMGNTYHSMSYTVEVGKWYHCVYIYDGETASLYLNGELVAQEEVYYSYRTPGFTNAKGAYICIGGCAQSKHNNSDSTGISGFIGDIAVCRLLPNVLTEADAKALYQAWLGES